MWKKYENNKRRLLKYVVSRNIRLLLIFFLLISTINIVLEGFEYRALNKQQYAELLEEKKNLLRAQVQALVASTISCNELGLENTDSALERVSRVVSTLRYDNGLGYFFLFNTEGVLLASGNGNEHVGSKVWVGADIERTETVQQLQRASLAPGGGFLVYRWPKPELGELSLKISYVTSIPHYGWILGTGLYIDDIQAIQIEKSIRAKNILIYKSGALIIVGLGIFLSLHLFSRRMMGAVRRELDLLNLGIKDRNNGVNSLDPQLYSIAEFAVFADSIGQSYSELKMIQAEQSKRIRELADSRGQVEESLCRVKRAEKAKNEFLANISHELRTPLTALIGLTDIFRDTSLDVEQEEYLGMMETSGYSLLSLVNDLLDLSKIESGEVVIESSEIALRTFIEELLLPYRNESTRKGLLFESVIDTELPAKVVSDPNRIRQIVSNLLSNAIKFTQTGGISVTISSEIVEGESMLSFKVTDTGCGIESEKLANIFERFYQADHSMSRASGGAGLGLGISRDLAKLLGGNVQVTSERYRGSTFIATVQIYTREERCSNRVQLNPASKGKVLLLSRYHSCSPILAKTLSEENYDVEVHAISPSVETGGYQLIVVDEPTPEQLESLMNALKGEVAPVLLPMLVLSHHEFDIDMPCVVICKKPITRSSILNVVRTFLDVGCNQGVESNMSVVDAPVMYSDRKVLLVEDNLPNQIVVKKILMKYGVDVSVAINGKDAYDRVTEEKFDLVLMDVQMPVMDGYDATRAIRKWEDRSNGARTPVVALTAHAFAHDRAQCLLAGMDDYLSKPVLLKSIESILAHYCS